MRAASRLLLVLLIASACAGAPATPQPPAVSAGPAVWPLRGTSAPSNDALRARPVAVKVDNDPAARPQTGLADADLVLEILVEGGITRFAVVYHSKDPSRVGPIRSARKSDLNYLPALHAILAHVGASEAVAKQIKDATKSGDFVDVDELLDATAFERTRDRQPPYNAYSSGQKIRTAAGGAGRDTVTVAALAFGEPPASGVDGARLAIPYSEPVRYEYDGKGAYRRTQGGTSGDALPENVVVIKTDVTEISGTADAAGAASVDFRATGTGTVLILRDGKRFDGTWSRQATGMYTFKDAGGAEIKLKPGLTWINIVPTAFDVSG